MAQANRRDEWGGTWGLADASMLRLDKSAAAQPFSFDVASDGAAFDVTATGQTDHVSKTYDGITDLAIVGSHFADTFVADLRAVSAGAKLSLDGRGGEDRLIADSGATSGSFSYGNDELHCSFGHLAHIEHFDLTIADCKAAIDIRSRHNVTVVADYSAADRSAVVSVTPFLGHDYFAHNFNLSATAGDRFALDVYQMMDATVIGTGLNDSFSFNFIPDYDDLFVSFDGGGGTDYLYLKTFGYAFDNFYQNIPNIVFIVNGDGSITTNFQHFANFERFEIVTDDGAYVVTGAFDDKITGGGALFGGGGDDVLQATSKDTLLDGGDGDDRLTGGFGSDELRGGDGVDTAIYQTGDWSRYVVAKSGAAYTVTNMGNGDVDTLYAIEQIQFANGAFAIGKAVNVAPRAVADRDATLIEAGTPGGGVDHAAGDVLDNDRDANLKTPGLGETLAVVGIAAGADPSTLVKVGAGRTVDGTYGTLTIHADGSFDYLLDNDRPTTDGLHGGQTGRDVFTYRIADAHGLTSTATLTLAIQGVDGGAPIHAPPLAPELPLHHVAPELVGHDWHPLPLPLA